MAVERILEESDRFFIDGGRDEGAAAGMTPPGLKPGNDMVKEAVTAFSAGVDAKIFWAGRERCVERLEIKAPREAAATFGFWRSGAAAFRSLTGVGVGTYKC